VPYESVEDDHAKHSPSRFVAFQDNGESTVEYHRKSADHASPSELLHGEPDLPRTSRCIELDEVADLTYGETPGSDQDGIKVYSRTLIQGGNVLCDIHAIDLEEGCWCAHDGGDSTLIYPKNLQAPMFESRKL